MSAKEDVKSQDELKTDLLEGEWSVVDSCMDKENSAAIEDENVVQGSEDVVMEETSKDVKENDATPLEDVPPKSPKSEDCTEDTKEIKDDSLIITNEDDLDIITEDKTEVPSLKSSKEASPVKATTDAPDKQKEDAKTPTKPKVKQDDVNYIWVTNIHRHTKATDLKEFFVRHGKVLTAKIVTNGTSLFGYVCMENHEIALKCIELSNGSLLDGKRVNLSMERPDQSKKRHSISEDKKITPVKAAKTKSENGDAKEKKDPLTKKYKPEEASTEGKKRRETDWKTEYHRAKNESENVRRRLLESNRRYEGLQSKCRRLETDLKTAEQQLKEDRRRHYKEKEELERKYTADYKRFVEDRAALNKDMDEVKHLREHLKLKIKEVEIRMHKHHKSRSQSPRRSNQPKKKWSEERMHRSPPPAPKLSENRKRQSEQIRHYYDEKKAKRSPPHQYNFNDARGRHRPDSKPLSVRNNSAWAVPPYQEPWRLQSAVVSNQQFSSVERYAQYPGPTTFVNNPMAEGGSFYRPPDYQKYDARKY